MILEVASVGSTIQAKIAVFLWEFGKTLDESGMSTEARRDRIKWIVYGIESFRKDVWVEELSGHPVYGSFYRMGHAQMKSFSADESV